MLTWPGKCCGKTICFNVTSCGGIKSGVSITVKTVGGVIVSSGSTDTSGNFCTGTLSNPSYNWTASYTSSTGVVLTETGSAAPGANVSVGFLCSFHPPNTPNTATLVDSLYGTCTLTYGAAIPGPYNGLSQFNGWQNASVQGVPNADCSTSVASDPRTTINCPVTYSLSCSDGTPVLSIAYPTCTFAVGATQYWAPTDAFVSPSLGSNCLPGVNPSSISNNTCSGLNVTYNIPAGPTSARGCGTPNPSYIDTKDIYASGATINVHF